MSGSKDGGIYKSVDGGQSWTKLLKDCQKVILEKLIWQLHQPIQIDFTHLSRQEKVRVVFMFLMIKDQVSSNES